MKTLDSEPDFDDVEAIEIAHTREPDKIISDPSGNHQRSTRNTSHMLKLGQRPGSRIGDCATNRQNAPKKILVGKCRNKAPSERQADITHVCGDEDSHDKSLAAADQNKFERHDKELNFQQIGRLDGSQTCALLSETQKWDLTNMDGRTDFAMATTTLPQAARHTGMEQVAQGLQQDALEVVLRRSLSEVTKKYNTLETRHNELLSIGIKAAELNFERLKRQSEEATDASNKLIMELKDEIAAQSVLILQNTQLKQQLSQSKVRIDALEKELHTLNVSFSHTKSEIQSLSAKLSASRAAGVISKAPGNTVKTGTSTCKSAPIDALLAAQAKEYLYGDLTGLIVSRMTRGDEEDVFDCIQTGRNGTLHFKLALESVHASDNYEDVQFTYKPQLDIGRDSDLMKILPDYLVEEITFTRTQASNFYARLNKSLTERKHCSAPQISS
ncbi:uncharacterized protein UV8b_05034 [Ustilaginoidea virens]|uniref:Monopolin complex subunit Csm1/Pcs1 C-terminal domain-containing protein n=1 Tax=Ustilaginoidea virens TaxID=1159556 RepID=A0A8E5MHQ9_USTVR|nr:uncharacterized protein UV8b_05034 [Ustilaginoidea virens]QUC20793.1 hypothetical protein UV8b_05034 [Ustilaginoidea virens]